MKKGNSKKQIKKAIIICIIVILILLLLLMSLYLLNKEDKEQLQPITQEEKEEVITEYVRNKGEKERMQIYLSEYIQHIERKEYNLAYAKLYPEFKKNYFQTEEIYIKYVENNYSELMMIDYDDIQRQGNYYILTVTITNLGEIETEKMQKFIIYENALNDYYLSFQAK